MEAIEKKQLSLINGVKFQVNSSVSLGEIKSTILQYLGVPNYTSVIGYSTERTHNIDIDNINDLIFNWDNVAGVNEYRWHDLHILIIIGFNNDLNSFYVAISKDNQIDDYYFTCKDISGFGYFGFLNRLTNLLEF